MYYRSRSEVRGIRLKYLIVCGEALGSIDHLSHADFAKFRNSLHCIVHHRFKVLPVFWEESEGETRCKKKISLCTTGQVDSPGGPRSQQAFASGSKPHINSPPEGDVNIVT